MQMAKAGEFHLISGRRVSLRELKQYGTYAGMMEGFPTAERNQEQLDRLVIEHKSNIQPGIPYLIRPAEKPIERSEGLKYPHGTLSALPAITCIGRFTSMEPARDQTSDMSILVVIWFQDDFAFPIDPGAMGELLTMDWERHASDWEF